MPLQIPIYFYLFLFILFYFDHKYCVINSDINVLLLCVENAKMNPNSNCWKKEETHSLAECVQCSDYETVNTSKMCNVKHI